MDPQKTVVELNVADLIQLIVDVRSFSQYTHKNRISSSPGADATLARLSRACWLACGHLQIGRWVVPYGAIHIHQLLADNIRAAKMDNQIRTDTFVLQSLSFAASLLYKRDPRVSVSFLRSISVANFTVGVFEIEAEAEPVTTRHDIFLVSTTIFGTSQSR